MAAAAANGGAGGVGRRGPGRGPARPGARLVLWGYGTFALLRAHDPSLYSAR